MTTLARYDPAFAEQGIRKWRKALEKFQKHKSSICHIQAMTAWAELREGTSQVDDILDKQKAADKSRRQKEAKENRQPLQNLLFGSSVICQ